MAAAEQGATTKRTDVVYRVPAILLRLGVITLGLALLGGCGGDTFSPDGGGGVPPVYVPGTATPGGDTPSSPALASVPFPPELVGTWSGDDAGGQGSWYIQFAPDGRYSMQNQRRGVAISGNAAINGPRMLLQPDGLQPYTVSWSIGNGRLSLDGSVYIRTDGNRADDLIGSWLSYDDLYKTLVFASDGTFQLQDQVNGNLSGAFSVNGSQLTLQAPGRSATTYEWSVSDGFLTLTRADGSVSKYLRS